MVAESCPQISGIKGSKSVGVSAEAFALKLYHYPHLRSLVLPHLWRTALPDRTPERRSPRPPMIVLSLEPPTNRQPLNKCVKTPMKQRYLVSFAMRRSGVRLPSAPPFNGIKSFVIGRPKLPHVCRCHGGQSLRVILHNCQFRPGKSAPAPRLYRHFFGRGRAQADGERTAANSR